MDNINETESLREELRRINHTIQCNKKAREELLIVNRHGIKTPPMASFILLWVVCAFVVALTIFAIYNNGSLLFDLAVGTSLTAGIILLNMLVYFPRVKKIRKIDAENKALDAELHIIEEKLKAIES